MARYGIPLAEYDLTDPDVREAIQLVAGQMGGRVGATHIEFDAVSDAAAEQQQKSACCRVKMQVRDALRRRRRR